MVDMASTFAPGRSRVSGFLAPTEATLLASSLVETRLGLFLVAGTERGVSFAMFGDERAALETELFQFAAGLGVPTAHSPAEAATQDRHSVTTWALAMRLSIDDGTPMPALPVDVQGTPFQRSVWAFLATIPRGKTVTYADVAAGIGHPQAVRAAASACGKNSVAVLVPCHRVIRGDGGLGGYRWGLNRKQALLDLEAGSLTTSGAIDHPQTG